MVHACSVCQGPFSTQGFMILDSIGTEKDTLVFYSHKLLTDGGTDGKLSSYIASCYKQVR